MNSSRTPRHEKSVLDKVEDMDVDNQSDQELCSAEEKVVGMSKSGTSQSHNLELMKEKSVESIEGNRNCIIGEKKVKAFTTTIYLAFVNFVLNNCALLLLWKNLLNFTAKERQYQ